jgi:hypothetical protein
MIYTLKASNGNGKDKSNGKSKDKGKNRQKQRRNAGVSPLRNGR